MPTEKVPKFGPKLFGTTVPSTIARPVFCWMAAHASASFGYSRRSTDWSSNRGFEPGGTPMKLGLERRPAKLAFGLTWRRAWDQPRGPVVKVLQPVCGPQSAEATLALAI